MWLALLLASCLHHIITLTGETPRYAPGKKPLDFLESAAKCYATAIKCSSKDLQAHLGLGLVMEEFFYAEDLYGLQREVGGANGIQLNTMSCTKAIANSAAVLVQPLPYTLHVHVASLQRQATPSL